MIQRQIGKPISIRDPDFIDRLVFYRYHPLDLAINTMNFDITANTVMGCDGWLTFELPTAGGKPERLRGQRTNRADINHVTRQFRFHCTFYIGADAHVFAAPGATHLLNTANFLTKPDAASAVDATGHFGRNQPTKVFAGYRAFIFNVGRFTLAKTQRRVLQVTFATFITNRTIQWVINQQKFHHCALCI